MSPDRPGIWEWFEADGTKRLVEVFNVNSQPLEGEEPSKAWLRVYWWGGYYNMNQETNDLVNIRGEVVMEDYVEEAEWADRWGNRVGDNNSLPEEQLYLGPTKEERDRILKQLEDLKEL